GQTIPTVVDFDLGNAAPAEGVIRRKCTAIRRTMQINLKSMATPSRFVGICGDNFWDKLTSHPEVVKTYLNWAAAADLRNGYGKEWSAFRYGEIEFVNYRGTDDGTTLGVSTNDVRFFPTGTGIFRWALSPGEKFEHLGTLGQETYSEMVVDEKRDQWADVEAYSYPLPVCTQPQALHRGTTST
ncbi:MAG: major capsid protein, partial [Bradyrhizobium sp.]